MNFFDGDFIDMGHCIDSNQFYGRTELYAGWPCLLDMDCHSKKCVKGVCIGKQEGEACNKHIDCVSGLFCEMQGEPSTC